MTFSKRFNPSVLLKTRVLKTSFLALAALGLTLPAAGHAQQIISSSSATRTSLEDGTYLFGQSPNPGVIGSAYAVFSVQDSRAVGAFYMPRSSYDCFSGEVSSTQLAVNVVNSYSQAVHPYAVAITATDALVAGEGAGAYTLDGFHRIDSLSEKDAEILAVCEADFSQ